MNSTPRPSMIEQAREAVERCFPLGLPALVLLVLALGALAGRAALLGGRAKGDRLVFWTFGEPHIPAYRTIAPAFEAEHGVSIDFQHVHYREIDRRLRAAMWSGRGVPDLVELPLEKSGSFFRGTIEQTGLVDLGPMLAEVGPSGLTIAEDAVGARVDANRHRAYLLGLPHDVHPTVIAYRWRDFQEMGIDPDSIETWDQFIEVGRQMTRLERSPGSPVDDRRYMLAIDEVTPNVFQAFVLQRGGQWFGPDGELLLDSDIVYDTVLWYTRLAYGPGRIADGAAAFPNQSFFQAIKSGYYVCFVCTDWLTKNLEDNLPGFAGELRLMPMPAWEPGGVRTSTWGSTMLAVTDGPSRELATELAAYLYASEEVARFTFDTMNIVSPFRSTWGDPVFAEPRDYFGGQRIGELFLSLADDVPTVRNGPFVPLVQQRAVSVLTACASYYRVNGEDGFPEFARRTLDEAAAYVRLQMRRNPF